MKVLDALCISIYSILLRKLRGIHSAVMNLVVALTGLIIVLSTAAPLHLLKIPEGLTEIGLILALGFTHNFAHLTLILALTFEQGTLILT
jgi:hypothetical protein